jgi:branched-chain amino acid transport system substrate-binding protein
VRALALSLGLAAVALLAAACGAVDKTPAAGEARSTFDAYACDGDIAVMAPYGGDSDTDYVQMNWARVALDRFNREHGTAFTLMPSNVDYDYNKSAKEARRIVANPNVIAVVGPKTSSATETAGPVFDLASDALQAPRMASFVADDLDPEGVLIVQDNEPYSKGLGDAVFQQLASRDIDVDRVQVEVEQESYSDVVTRVTPSVDVVVAPLLVPDDARRMVEELHAAGKYPTIVGGDALFVNAFGVPGAYVTTYAPDISRYPGGREIIRLYQSIFGDFESFGGPAYVAMQVVLTAALDVCERDQEVTRSAVTEEIPNVRLEESILNMPIAFDERHELEGATINVYRVGPNGYDLVG